MNITAQFTQVRDRAKRVAGEVRINFSVLVETTSAEAALIEQIPFVTTTTKCPIKLFHFPNRMVITAATNRTAEHNGEIRTIEAFVKAMMPIRSYVPDAMLRFAVPGRTNFGFINQTDHAQLSRWLTDEFENISRLISDEMGNALKLTEDRAFTSVSHGSTLTTTETKVLTRTITPVVAKVGRLVLLADE